MTFRLLLKLPKSQREIPIQVESADVGFLMESLDPTSIEVVSCVAGVSKQQAPKHFGRFGSSMATALKMDNRRKSPVRDPVAWAADRRKESNGFTSAQNKVLELLKQRPMNVNEVMEAVQWTKPKAYAVCHGLCQKGILTRDRQKIYHFVKMAKEAAE